MSEETKQSKFGGKPSLDQLEQWRISNDRREIDLVSIVDSRNLIIQTETKSAKPGTSVQVRQEAINKAIDQVKFFQGYLKRMHGCEAKKFQFIPILAFPNLSKAYHCFCTRANPPEGLISEVQNGYLPIDHVDVEHNIQPDNEEVDINKLQIIATNSRKRNCHSQIGEVSDIEGKKPKVQLDAMYKRVATQVIEEGHIDEHNQAVVQNGDHDCKDKGNPYVGCKYQTCAARVKGQGCLFFKWDWEERPGPQQNSSSACFCGGVPLTIKMSLQEPKKKGSKKQKKKTEGKSFQVCKDKKCKFFCWVNETPRKDPGYHPDPRNPILELVEGDDKRKHTCE